MPPWSAARRPNRELQCAFARLSTRFGRAPPRLDSGRCRNIPTVHAVRGALEWAKPRTLAAWSAARFVWPLITERKFGHAKAPPYRALRLHTARSATRHGYCVRTPIESAELVALACPAGHPCLVVPRRPATEGVGSSPSTPVCPFCPCRSKRPSLCIFPASEAQSANDFRRRPGRRSDDRRCGRVCS